MKICVIGPVVTDRHVGGVATFTEALADSFALLGHETIILTNRADKACTDHNVRIISLDCGKFLFFIKSAIYLKKQAQDFLIGSTWYDFSLAFNPKIRGKKVHYLHGFGVPADGIKKALLIALNDKYHAKNGTVIANSEFTRMINEVFFKIKVDAVVPIGIAPGFQDIRIEKKFEDRTYDLLYVGRVRYNKGVDRMIRAAAVIKKKYGRELKVAVIGDGPQLDEIKSMAEMMKTDVVFAGKISQKETIAYYCESKIFVSLDYKEPYGQTFAEAAVCGCRIVCPDTGGQIEYLSDYPQLFECTTIYDDEKIAGAIFSLLNAGEVQYPEGFYHLHSYEQVARNILNAV